jgi:hypothetical protein
MKCASVLFAVVACIAGLIGAWYWLRASNIFPVSLSARLGLSEPADRVGSINDQLAGQNMAMTGSAELNWKTAVSTAIAVAFGTVGNLLNAWPIWPCSN